MEQKKPSSHDQAQFPTPGSASDASTSFISRIGASASALAQESLLRPNPGSVVNELSSVEAGKSGSSSSSAGSSATSMSLQISTTNHSSSFGADSSDSAHPNFRSQPPSEKTQTVIHDFDSFLSLQDQEQSNMDQHGDCSQLVPFLHPVGSDASLSEREIATPPALGRVSFDGTKDHVPNGHPADGAAVVAMLSDPSFCIDEDPYLPAEVEDVADVKSNHGNPAGSLAQRTSTNICPSVKPLSLIPDFHEASNKPLVNSFHDHSRLPDKWQAETVVPKSYCDQEFEVRPWVEILTTYHDEVWGDMLPLVEAARKEANAIQNGDADHGEDFPAIRRLAMIARHMRPKASS
ncbi:MAG: hypothetical protein L6R38_008519 [Xanthoria sp. 2 TBL-2021]|nr:MAG: hypothetical protein L6R38_008519 [Xanthoria sp. 2 TBL-2021]